MKNLLKTLSICLLILMTSCKDKSNNEGETSVSNEPVVESNDIQKVEPPHWWIGFKNQKLQLDHSNKHLIHWASLNQQLYQQLLLPLLYLVEVSALVIYYPLLLFSDKLIPKILPEYCLATIH